VKEYSRRFDKDALFADLCQSVEAEFGTVEASIYKNDPVKFAVEVVGCTPTGDQEEILRGLQKHGHVSVRSGHGIGKSTALALAILWFMSTRKGAKIPVTAPTSHQLFDVLWSELITWHRKMDPAFRDQFEYTSDKFCHKEFRESWFCVARTARPERPEALQGFHGENLLFVIDEAAGVADGIFEVAMGSLTNKQNWCLMAGNPTRLSGFFFDSFHADRARWKKLHFSSLESPLVDKSYSKRMAKKYGEGSNIYRVRVLGEFPSSEEDQLIPLHVLEAAVDREIPDAGPVVWGLDVARFGSDATCLAKRKGDRIQEILQTRNLNLMQVTGWVANQIQETPLEQRPSTIFVDSIGYGAGVADRLRELGYPALDVNVAERPSSKEKYANLRAELWCEFRDALYQETISLPSDEDLLAQCATIKYSFHSSGKLMIERKEDLKRRGLPSPDRADAVRLTFYQDTRLFPYL
jgi:phage terminase large subunit